ncbi:hypothetical protein KEM54_000391, partial [Ascosphaera aggregata]
MSLALRLAAKLAAAKAYAAQGAVPPEGSFPGAPGGSPTGMGGAPPPGIPPVGGQPQYGLH